MPNQKHILIAEDEEGIRDFIQCGLTDFGYSVTTATDGLQAWKHLANTQFDLVVLDIRMPGMSGTEVCKKLRALQGYASPVMMLTALGTTDDIVMGLHAGADDYMVKPFKFMELLARIEALLRRVEAMEKSKTTSYANLQIDPVSHKAILSRRQILKDVWDKNFDTNTNVVDVYVKYLRTKIDKPFEQRLIHSIVGIGYVFGIKE